MSDAADTDRVQDLEPQVLTDEEMHMLAVRWPNLPIEVRQQFRDKMSRAQFKRFERTLLKLAEDRKTYETKVMTRQDVAVMLGTYTERSIYPLVVMVRELQNRVDFLERPWRSRLRVSIAVRIELALRWLESKGIRIVQLPKEPSDAPVNEAKPGGAEGAGVAEAPGGSNEPGITPPAPPPSLIEVVPR